VCAIGRLQHLGRRVELAQGRSNALTQQGVIVHNQESHRFNSLGGRSRIRCALRSVPADTQQG
jgi:hypothetical protein